MKSHNYHPLSSIIPLLKELLLVVIRTSSYYFSKGIKYCNGGSTTCKCYCKFKELLVPLFSIPFLLSTILTANKGFCFIFSAVVAKAKESAGKEVRRLKCRMQKKIQDKLNIKEALFFRPLYSLLPLYSSWDFYCNLPWLV